MVEYNGSIEVIGGLKPINGRDFPLVNAPDVLMPDGRRLSDIDFENLGGGDTFPVPFGLSTETIDATCEVPYSEIATAVEEGKFVYGILDWVGMPVVLPFKGILSLYDTNDDKFALFETALDFMGLQMSVLIHENGEIETRASQITDGDGGGDSVAETFPVEFVVNPADFTATCDKTFDDIYAAVGEGKFIYGRFTIMGAVEYAPFMIPFIGFGEDSQRFAQFEGTYEMMGMKASIMVLADGNVMTQVSEIGSGGGTAPSVPPTGVDMSRFESNGIIKETYADGSVKTTTIEYDSTGNPVKITDGDGNVTEFTW